jgi:uncharacterized protein DUF1828
MSIDCTDLREALASSSLVRDCDVVQDGLLRVATPLQYPEGSNIDVFIRSTGDIFDSISVSDLGQTVAYLADLHIYPFKTKKRRQLVSDICDTLGVMNENGEFGINLVSSDSTLLTDAVLRVSQACLRIADLSFTQRFPVPSAFRDDVEEFLANVDQPFEPDVELPGAFGRPVTIDFEVRGRALRSLLLTLSTANAAASHALANEVFRKWYDILPSKNSHQFVTLYDSQNDVFRADDLERLKSLSAVFAFPAEQQQIRESLMA